MKIKWYVLIVSVSIIFSTTFAFAEEPEDLEGNEIEIDEATRTETEIMDDPNGSEIRLLQLEISLEKNICAGEYVVSNLTESGYDTLELEAIIAEMGLLKQEIQAIYPNSSEAISLFVELKNDAIELTKEFRDTIQGLVDATKQEQLRVNIQALVCEQAQGLEQQIQNRIVLFNSNRLYNIYGSFGEKNCSLIHRYQNGTASLNQVKEQIEGIINKTQEEKRFELFSEMKGVHIRKRIQTRASIENISDNYQERKCIRIRNRLNNSESIDDETIRNLLQQRMMNRLNELDSGTGSGDGSGQGGGDGPGDGDGNSSSSGNGGNGHNHSSGGGGPG